jgi:glycosyltransferase involved in cell wall biosynthesis
LKVVALVPVYNDWEAARHLVLELDSAFAGSGTSLQVVLLDDGSSSGSASALAALDLHLITAVDVVQLRRNLGHQRAVAVGLAFVQARIDCDVVLVMDGDGEDSPSDALRLLAALEGQDTPRVVFAERTRRSEGLFFQTGYLAFRIAHRILTGHRIRFGNFSVVPRALLDRLVGISELWNHYVAAVVVARVPYSGLPTARAKRLFGKSNMGLQDLVIHGFRALSVFSERIGVRALTASVVVGLLAAVVLLPLLLIPSVRDGSTFWVVAGTLALLWGLAAEGVVVSAVFLFATLGTRSLMGFLPLRDWEHFVLEVARLGGTERREPMASSSSERRAPGS